MDINHDTDPAIHDTAADGDSSAADEPRDERAVAAAVAAYQSAVLTEQQTNWWLEDMRCLVLASDPCSLDDARTMLASTARFLTDSAAPPVRTLAEMLTEIEVARWARIRMATGANPATMSNHLQRLRRLMRVQRGLPARIAVQGQSSPSRSPFGQADLARLIHAMRGCEASVVAAFVAAVGCGLVGSDAVGGQIERTDEYHVLRRQDGSTRRITDELSDLVAGCIGAAVTNGSWKRAREVAAACEVELTKEVAVSTFCRAAVDTPGAAVDVVTSFALSRKLIDRGLEHVDEIHDPQLRARLRG